MNDATLRKLFDPETRRAGFMSWKAALATPVPPACGGFLQPCNAPVNTQVIECSFGDVKQLALCKSCAVEHTQYWDDAYSDYYTSIL